jgi:hypothetical protein
MIKLYALDSYMALNKPKLIKETFNTPIRLKSAKPKEQRIYANERPVLARHDLDSNRSINEDNSPLS